MSFKRESNVLSELENLERSRKKSESKDRINAQLNSAFIVYILRTYNNQLYIGHTNNLDRREIEHKQFHHGAKFIKDNLCKFTIVYKETIPSRELAMKREKQLKGWTRAKKEALISGNIDLLKKL